MLADTRLYFVTGVIEERVLAAALEGGIDVVQLREKRAPDERLVRAGAMFRRLTREAGALFVVNDDPYLALRCEADGVHVGQDDIPVAEVRKVAPELLVGLSTHSPGQIAAARDADYIGVGPVYETPTKPDREPVGLGLVREAARSAPVPWFAIGGIDAANVGEVLAAGATRIAVVRAIADAPDPRAAARALRDALDGA